MTLQFIPGERVEIPEIGFKDEVLLAAEKTAIVVVDMQNDFVKEGGTLVGPDAAKVIPAIQQLLSVARAKGVKVAYTQDTHYEGDKEWGIWPAHCQADTWGWEIVDELAPQPEDLICQKSRYDGFYGTSLEHYLTNVWKVENLILVGTVSSICVLHTAASAGLRWFQVVVPNDGTAALTDFDQVLTLHQISTLYTGSVVRTVGDIVFV